MRPSDARAPAKRPSTEKIARLARAVLAYNVAVILWGAFVRATGSGAGCGRHWPLCNGEIVPRPQSLATLIEALHRITSGIAVVAVVVLLVVVRVGFPAGHRARKGAGFATAFVLGEALIGAGLVLFELVAHDASIKRGLSIVLHLGNTFLLLGALALTAWWTAPEAGAAPVDDPPADAPPRRSVALRAVLAAAVTSILVVGASGAVAALGDTLFPASSLREGIAQDLSPVTHVFLRLRLLHPVLALCAGVLVLVAAGLVRTLATSPRARRLARWVTLLFVCQFGVGLLNVTLLAPIALQLVHLFLADATWIALVLMTWEAWAVRPAAAEPVASKPAMA